jgi:hypothetical protein
MATEKDPQKEGFEHLVSDISDVLAIPEKTSLPRQSPQPQVTRPPAPVREDLSNEVGSDTRASPALRSSWFARNRGNLIVWGVILGFIALVSLDDKPSSSTSRTREVAEEKPPEGSGLVLSYAQIRYCLAEEVRLNELQRLVSSYADLEVALFNSAVDDYNKRCSNYRYSRGALDTVRKQVESRRSEIEQQARARLAQWRR